jgi:hypothetical protein
MTESVRTNRLQWFREHTDVVLFVLLLALWIYEWWVLLQGELRFTADSERDLLIVYGLSHHGILPDDGIRMAALGLDLGPLYFLLLAPLNAVWTSPQTVHVLNITLGVAGLCVFYAWFRAGVGRAAALIGCVLYTQSAAHVALTDTVWHVGATPGVALAMLAAMGWWVQTGRRAALILGGVLLACLVQLHALGSVYVLAAIALLIVCRHHLTRRTVITLVVSVVITLLPLFIYAISSLFDPAEGSARHSGGFSWDPGKLWEGVSALVQPRYLLSATWGGRFVLVLVAVSALGTIQRYRQAQDAQERPWFRLFLWGQLAIGSVVVSLILSYENVGRYLLPVLFPVFALAALGIADIDAWLVRRKRTPRGRTLTWVVVVLGLALVQAPVVNVWATLSDSGQTLQSDGRSEPLSLEEQEAVVSFLVEERGLIWDRMRGRVHGVFFGPLSGIRYLERAHRDAAATSLPFDPTHHWLVLPDGLSPPTLTAGAMEHVTLSGRTRDIHLWRYSARFDPTRVRNGAGDPCEWPFPYLWSEAPSSLLQQVGFPRGHGPDIHRCLAGTVPGTLLVEIPAETNELTLQLSDDALFRRDDEAEENPVLTVQLAAEGFPPIPLQPIRRSGTEKRWYQITMPPREGVGTLHLTLRPRGHLGFLDLY